MVLLNITSNMEDIDSATTKLQIELRELYREKTRLDNQSYSQSNPGAVMERRWVRREIDKKERALTELRKKKTCVCDR
jgi:hypothetical protein